MSINQATAQGTIFSIQYARGIASLVVLLAQE